MRVARQWSGVMSLSLKSNDAVFLLVRLPLFSYRLILGLVAARPMLPLCLRCAMVNCSVHFYRNVFGVPFIVPRGTVNIRSARDETRAIEAAKRKFARTQGVESWTLRADTFDLVRLSGLPDPDRSTPSGAISATTRRIG